MKRRLAFCAILVASAILGASPVSAGGAWTDRIENVGTVLAVLGLVGSASLDARRREGGWLLGAVGLGALGVAWVAAVGSAG